ncbi:deaminase [Candidatus Saccharibacteria bacterium]|nr:deaminase [Candidatus Saccharibacteria bacterium]
MSLSTTFILAPREMSDIRVKQLLKKYLARGRVVFGVAEEEFIAGFENQPQFKTLNPGLIKSLATKSNGHLEVLEYPQSKSIEIISSLDFTRAVIINGSFHRSFHLRPEFTAIQSKGAKIKYESPFVDEDEAKTYATNHAPPPQNLDIEITDTSIQNLIKQTSARAFITDFQTAAAVVKNGKILALSHNLVSPYETYAWHFGISREKHQSPPGSSQHYDATHAETAALIQAGSESNGATLYLGTFPCPHCARNIATAGISEIVYEHDYGDPYSYTLFDRANIKYRRFHE